MWDTNRRKQLPKDWNHRRQQTATRAHGQCQHQDQNGRCPNPGTDCDHINPGNNHNLNNLQWLCKKHHKQKTNKEAQTARARTAKTHKYPTPKHPGLT